MPTTITIREETAAGKPQGQYEVELLTERVTARELIRSRIYQEVKDRNLKASQAVEKPNANGSLSAENTPQGIRVARDQRPASAKKDAPIDWQEQFERALDAFTNRQILVLVDDQQIVDPDEEITVVPETVVTFVRLVPLVGG